MRRILIFALILFPALVGSSLGAQTATLVRDVNPASYVPVEAAEGPRQFTPVAGGAVFFTLGSSIDGTYPDATLWFTDGTAAGTRVAAAFCRSISCFRTPVVVATLPGLAFFVAESEGDLLHLPRLWRTDGTAAGTFALTPELYSFADSDSFLAFGGRLLFGTCVQQGSVCSLWRTDGTAAGTVALAPVAVTDLVEAGGKAYFLGYGTGGRGLWRTDGTARGTQLVRRIAPGNYLWGLEAAGSRLFFMSGENSGRVWTSDGTPAGTKPVKGFFESDHDFIPRMTQLLKAAGDGKITLVGIREGNGLNLWLSDGSTAGTVRLTDAPLVPAPGRWVPRENQIETLGKRIVFIAGSRLWSSGGSMATTRAVGRCPGGCPEVPADSPLVRTGNRVVFAGRDAAHGTEPWVSDGTGPGTRLLADLCPGPCDSKPTAFKTAGGFIWFRAGVNGTARLVRTDGTAAGTAVLGRAAEDGTELDLAVSGSGGKVFFKGFDPRYGVQPWVSDGTGGGTRRVTALPGHGGSSDPMDLTVFGDRLLFAATDGRETGLWTAGAAGASPIPGITAPASAPAPMDVTVAGGLAFYVPGGTSELWRTDATAAGTLRLAAFPGQTLSELHDLRGRLVFLVSAADGTAVSFWASDGTATGTVKLFDLPAGTRRVSDIAVVGPELYFAADTSATKTQVFRSDGTAAGTRPVLDLPCVNCTSPYYPLSYARLGDLVYFTAWANGSNFSGPALWQTDGTAAGTVRRAPDPANTGALKLYFPASVFAFGGDLYFLAHDPTVDDGDRTVLFRGQDENAVRLAPVGSPPFQAFSPAFTPVGNTLFFRAWDPEHGIELWKTDGTPQGTALVRDVLPGPAFSDPQDLTAAGGRLYFSARDAVHGRELWVSDGTAAGTLLVQDLFPGGLSSAPEQLTLVDGRLYFTADDGVAGREPWSLGVP